MMFSASTTSWDKGERGAAIAVVKARSGTTAPSKVCNFILLRRLALN